EDGLVAEHGQHVMLGFYDEMRALIRRAGVDPEATSVSGGGDFYIYEERDQETHHLHLGRSSLKTLFEGLSYTGFSGREKSQFASFFIRVMPEVISGVPESLDDMCLTAWCLQHGFPVSLMATNAMRCSREAQLNWPGEISAYSMLKTIQVTGRDYTSSEAHFPAGGMSAIWWDPIAAHIERLGGKIERYRKLVAISHNNGVATGLTFAFPIPHLPGERYVEGSIPTIEGSEELIEDFDAVILTLPPPALQEVIAHDPVLCTLPGLSNVRRLATIAPLGLHVWHRETVRAKYPVVVAGLAPPLGFVLDNKPHYAEYRNNPAIGAALHFVGQETLFEDDDDELLLERAMHSVRLIPGYEAMDLAGVLDFQVIRNRSPHKRYWNAEPGSLKFKPFPKTNLDGLFLAGDWVRGEFEFPCMETAVRSGRNTASMVLKELRQKERQARRRRVA
ncbi:MAG: hypothetical protein HN348_03525, partial [Proteobacteria bacterium]|nr:hypothetical protein [Pseudomonadota bacterium]